MYLERKWTVGFECYALSSVLTACSTMDIRVYKCNMAVL